MTDLGINNIGVQTFMRDEPPTSSYGVINLDNKTGSGTNWVCFVNIKNNSVYFDSFGVNTPVEIKKQLNKPLTFGKFQIQDIFSKLCGAYCLYLFYLLGQGISFEEAVTKLYFETFNR